MRFKAALCLCAAIGVVLSLVVAERFAYTGYWDDTLLFVRLSEDMPHQPIEAVRWTMAQQDDLYAPLLMIPLYIGSVTGILSNWYLILVANLALVVLVTLLIWISYDLGFGAIPSFVAGTFVFVSPQLIDQRTWYVPVQHTLTTILLVAASYASYRQLRRPKGTRFIELRNIIVLDFLMIFVALGREIAIPFALIAIATILLTRYPRRWQTATAWLIPLLMLTQGTLSGRGGSHVETMLNSFVPGFLGDIRDLFTTESALLPMLVTVGAVLILQAVLVRRLSNRDYLKFKMTVGHADLDKWERRSTVGLLMVAFLFIPRIAATTASLFPPLILPTAIHEYLGRWSLGEMNSAVVVAFSLLVTPFVMKVHKHASIVLLATVLSALPYLLSDSTIFGAVDYFPGVVFFSRYTVYFLPAVTLVSASLLHLLFGLIGNRRSKMYLLTVGAVLLASSVVQTVHQVSVKRVAYRSVILVESPKPIDFVSVCPSEELSNFLYWKYPEQLFPDIHQSLLDDRRIMGLSTDQLLGKLGDQACLREYRAQYLGKVLGGFASGPTQDQITQVLKDLDSGQLNEFSARELLLEVARQMRRDGRLPNS